MSDARPDPAEEWTALPPKTAQSPTQVMEGWLRGLPPSMQCLWSFHMRDLLAERLGAALLAERARGFEEGRETAKALRTWHHEHDAGCALLDYADRHQGCTCGLRDMLARFDAAIRALSPEEEPRAH